MKNNNKLKEAKARKNDEFYTRLEDIENEVKYYKAHFKDQVVYCNCDDPEWSNFFIYFKMNFHHLKLKKLISTHYSTDTESDKAYQLECVEVINKKGTLEEKKTILEGNGDFRSDECIELLKQSDIVCTNPPFSLFREYVSQLVEYNKKFLILGNNNAITYKEVFSLIKENKLWLGYSANKTMEFQLADDYERWNRIDEKTGKKFGNVPAISWFTNLTHKKRNESLVLWKKFCSDDFPKYDNLDAINIDKVNDIPENYFEPMGVPITFLGKYNPSQFEIIGLCADKRDPDEIFIKASKTYLDEKHKNFVGTVLNGKATYARIIIRNITTTQGV